MKDSNCCVSRSRSAWVSSLLVCAGLAHAGQPDSGRDRVITAEQQALELQALELLRTPVGRQAKLLSGRYLRNFGGVPGLDAAFDKALQRTAFCGALMSSNSDTNFPLVHAQQTVPDHSIGTVRIEDSSCGIPDPDTVYRFIPVDGTSHYVITGQVAKHRPIENNFTLGSYNLTTIDNINGRDLQVAPDGSFQITIDSEPANGRPNHLQSRHDAFQVWIRDTLGDWSVEKPNRLSVKRLDKDSAVPVGQDGRLAMLGRYISYIVYSMPADVINGTANAFKNPKILGGSGGAGGFLVTQAYSNGRFDLKDDEALVLNVKLGFARYFVVPATNVWGTNDGADGKMGALNNFQAEANADGTYTFVVSKGDPLIANWIGTGGLNQGTLYLRWAGFPAGDLSKLEAPTVSTAVVKLSEIDKMLPEAHRPTAEERRQQCQKRAELLYRRQTDE